MRRVLLSSCLIFFMFPAFVSAQRDSVRSVFLDAESYFLFEEYSEAQPLYESLLRSDPTNDNLNYKLGICYLNDPYQKDKAIGYLQKASNNINPAYKQGNYKERTAPPDALYYLGSAYLVNELLDRAIDSYEAFMEIMDRNVYDEELVEDQIQSCRNAKRMETMPVDIDLLLLDSLINTRYAEIRPVLSGDGTKMTFVTELPFYDAAFYTEKQDDGWSYPQLLTQMLGFDQDIYPVALNYDGTEMILYYDDNYIGNLYYSRMEDGLWSPAVKMDEPISTKYWESSASFSRDGRTLYFTSNRKGTLGGLDIWVSQKDASGKWGEPENLGPTINTRFNEECPCISEDGKTLYFSSYGHYNMGGYDIFYTRKNADGSWAEPVNMGYPINTTDHDLYFQPVNQGNEAYYSLYSPRGIGRRDIYYMTIYSANNPRFYTVRGTLRTYDGRLDTTRMAIYVIDTEQRDTVLVTEPAGDGTFALKLKQGIYELHFTGEEYEELIRPLQITSASDKTGIALPDNMELASLEPEEEAPVILEGEASQIELDETRFEAEAGAPLVIPFTAPRGSTVVVRTYRDNVLVSTDTLVTERRRNELQIVPLAGNSEVELEMVDRDGNLNRNRLAVSGYLAETEPEEAMEQLAGEEALPEETVQAEAAPGEEEAAPGEEEATPEEAAAGAESVQGPQVPPLEVTALYEEMLQNSQGDLREILESLDLSELEVRSVEEFRDVLTGEMELKGFKDKEKRQIISEYFGEGGTGTGHAARKPSWTLWFGIIVVGCGLIWLFIAWWRRRGKRNEQED